MLEPLGEVGANFSLQLSSRTQFTKINNKKVIAKNQCEKHKKLSLEMYHMDLHVWTLYNYKFNEVDMRIYLPKKVIFTKAARPR